MSIPPFHLAASEDSLISPYGRNGGSRCLLRPPRIPHRVAPGEEGVDLSEYLDYHDACRQPGRFLDDVYTHRRIRSSLGYLASAEFEELWRSDQAVTLEWN
jgi:hypothetical protein